jgi:hypothetical protein
MGKKHRRMKVLISIVDTHRCSAITELTIVIVEHSVDQVNRADCASFSL